MSTKQVANLTWTIDRQLLAAWECLGQSCLAADASGSTGKTPSVWPEGGKDADKKCIARYNPAMATLGTRAPNGPKQTTGFSSMLMGGLNSIWRPLTEMFGSTVKGTFTGTCSKNILIFAKGTLEPGAFGVLVGPSFTSGLPTGWTTYPVRYDPDIPGDYCLGLPGGMVAKDIINQAAQKCPDSDLYLSGYSQGAMVARNGIAYASPSAKAKVKGVVTFGDPFNGAPIKGYKGPIAIFCNHGDGVCTGNFELAGSHLSYGFDTSAKLAQKKLLDFAANPGSATSSSTSLDDDIPPVAATPKGGKAKGGKAKGGKGKGGGVKDRRLRARDPRSYLEPILSQESGTIPVKALSERTSRERKAKGTLNAKWRTQYEPTLLKTLREGHFGTS